MAGMEYALGIYFGLRDTCAAIWRPGRLETMANSSGQRVTPSCVAFDAEEILIGEAALDQAFRNPANTIFDVKWMIGRRYSDDRLQKSKELYWPFKVVAGDNDMATIVVEYKGEERRFLPEEIYAMILSEIKKNAEVFLGFPVRKSVITVPPYFNNAQREATKSAGKIAGFDDIQLLEEPVAAIMAYEFDRGYACGSGRGKRRIVVFHLGGRTLDVSLVELNENGVLEVKASVRDTYFGGEDFDNRMVDELVKVFHRQHGEDKDIRSQPRCMRRLKTACENAKRNLSIAMKVDIYLDGLNGEVDFHYMFNRVKFEELNMDLFERCLGPLKQCLEDAKVDHQDDVDEVVLVGGSSRIPRLQEMLKEFFHGAEKLSNRINPDEAVAFGAAIRAASLMKNITVVNDPRRHREFCYKRENSDRLPPNGKGGREHAVGIDLGTTYSCVGLWRNGKVEIIQNDLGNRITPSCVAFTSSERLIGEGAVNQHLNNLANTFFNVKRLIGRSYKDDCVQQDTKRWPFKVVAGDNDKPLLVVEHEGKERRFHPEEISAMILSKMKKCAEKFLGSPVKKAVVTVPAYFNNSQRESTKAAGTIAGLDVIQVLNEPTAAALAYGLDNRDLCSGDGKRRVLIFDLGGGTFDVSLLELDSHGVLEVKATRGDTHLGGEDFDNRMVDELVKVFHRKYGGDKDIRSIPKCMRKLKTACENAKRNLSTQTTVSIDLDSLYGGDDFHYRFSRVKFEELNKDLFEKCLGPLKQCLEDAGVDKESVDEVVLVGGSTRIPEVQKMVKDFFGGLKQLSNRVNPDEAVAYGAAIKAESLVNGGSSEKAPDVVLLDVAPLSLGLSDEHGSMNVLIPRNTRIPFTIRKDRVTAHDNQTSALFEIFEGERPLARDNNLLGEFELTGLRPAPKGKIRFQVIFEVDANGILTVTATNRDNYQDKGIITISRDKRTLNKDEIDRMIRTARELEIKDKERQKAISARHDLEEYASKISSLMDGSSQVSSKLKKESRKKLETALNTVNKWIEENDDAQYHQYELQKDALEREWKPIRMELEKSGIKI